MGSWRVCSPRVTCQLSRDCSPLSGVNFHCEQWDDLGLGDFEVFLWLLLMGHLTCFGGRSAPYCWSCQAPRWLRPLEHSGSKLGMPKGLIWGWMEVWGSQGCKKHCSQLLQPIRTAPAGWVQARTPLRSSSISLASCPSAQGCGLSRALHSQGATHLLTPLLDPGR